MNFVVRAEKKSGKKSKPVYDTFQKFYDYEKEVQKISNKGVEKRSRFAGLSEFLKKKGE